MLLFLCIVIFVESFEKKNFDFDITEMVGDLENDTTNRVREKRAFAHGTIITVDCSRGVDQASSTEPKFLVFPDFPDMMYKPIKCVWSIAASPSTYVQVNIKELTLPCAGGNKLLIIDGRTNSKAICGKKPPMITSTENGLDFHLMLNRPPPTGARVQIGFMQKDNREGWTVAEFNAGKKAGTAKNPKIDRSGRMSRKPGTTPKRRVPPTLLKSAGGQAPQQSKQSPQGGAPKGPPNGPPSRIRGPPAKPRGTPLKAPADPYHVRKDIKHTTREGPADRWEKVDRRPVLIGGGCAFLFLILGVAFYIGKIMKKDEEQQSKLNAENKEKPRFKIPDPVEVIDTKPAEKTESFETTTTEASDKPLTEKPKTADKS